MIRALSESLRRAAFATVAEAAAARGGGGGCAVSWGGRGGVATTPTCASSSGAAAAAAAVKGRRFKGNARSTRPHDVPVADRPYIANMIVERIPFVVPELPQWEVEYKEWSFKRAERYRKELPEEFVNPKTEGDDIETEHATFQAAPLETEADNSGDVRTIFRKMDQFLFLVVQDKSTGEWGFPKRHHEEGETMREAAKKAMDECLGNSIETFLVGNAPLGHFLESKVGGVPVAAGGGGSDGGGDSDGAQKEIVGEGKTGGGKGTNFYHRAQWLEGELRLEPKYKDFKWLTKVRTGRTSAHLTSTTG